MNWPCLLSPIPDALLPKVGTLGFPCAPQGLQGPSEADLLLPWQPRLPPPHQDTWVPRPPGAAPGPIPGGVQWGLLLDSRCDRLPAASAPGWPPGSGKVLLWLRPLAPPRWRLQRSPLRMSWMCCTIRLMATAGDRQAALSSQPQPLHLPHCEGSAGVPRTAQDIPSPGSASPPRHMSTWPGYRALC